MSGLWLCAIGLHRFRLAPFSVAGDHAYRECSRCGARHVRPSPLSRAPIHWDWVRGGAPTAAFTANLETTMTIEPNLTLEQAKAVVATKTAPRVTEDSIKAKIANVRYIHEDATGLTICLIKMQNGWVSTGVSAPASLANYDMEVGKRYAYDNAFKPLWQLEGYLLRERLATEDLMRNRVQLNPAILIRDGDDIYQTIEVNGVMSVVVELGFTCLFKKSKHGEISSNSVDVVAEWRPSPNDSWVHLDRRVIQGMFNGTGAFSYSLTGTVQHVGPIQVRVRRLTPDARPAKGAKDENRVYWVSLNALPVSAE